MCDDIMVEESQRYLRSMSRRDFSRAAAGATLAFSLPHAFGAEALVSSNVTIETPDNSCDASFVHPVGGTHPAVSMWPDIPALHPAFQ